MIRESGWKGWGVDQKRKGDGHWLVAMTISSMIVIYGIFFGDASFGEIGGDVVRMEWSISMAVPWGRMLLSFRQLEG